MHYYVAILKEMQWFMQSILCGVIRCRLGHLNNKKNSVNKRPLYGV